MKDEVPFIYALITHKLNKKYGAYITIKEIRSYFTRPLGINKKSINEIIKEMQELGLLERAKKSVNIDVKHVSIIKYTGPHEKKLIKYMRC